MLATYQTELLNLIQAPQQPVPLITSAQQITFINQARLRVAGEGECVRGLAALTISGGTQTYAFAQIGGYPVGVNGTLAVRRASLGGAALDVRPWEWFSQYYLYSANTGTPQRMSQQGQGASGTLWFDPVPTAPGTVILDIVGLPTPLATDADVEAIPTPWVDAVPFYAAWLAFQNLQRQADADKMMARYADLMLRSRQEATPTVLPDYLPGGQGAVLAGGHRPVASSGGR
jgi:hypothetical protein